MKRVADKVAIVTGAARGIGAAIAKALVDEGAKVLLTDVLESECRVTAERLGPNARFEPHDVASADDWSRVIQVAMNSYGNVSVLVNNAGIVTLNKIEEVSESEFRRIVDVNMVGVFLGMKAAAETMREAGGGSIINISSVAGIVGNLHALAYTGTKFAVRGMTKAAALELAADNIRVNSVHPGPIQTPMTSNQDGFLEEMKAICATVPLGRLGQPDEVAKMVLFLASDESSFSTGAEFIVDGGYVSV